MGPMEIAIRDRKSVRTYDGKALSYEDGMLVANLLDEAGNPFGCRLSSRSSMHGNTA